MRSGSASGCPRGTTTGIDFQALPEPPPGGVLASVGVNGSTSARRVAIDGAFTSGAASFGGASYGCTGGTVEGDVRRSPRPLAMGHDLTFDSLSITCTTPSATPPSA